MGRRVRLRTRIWGNLPLCREDKDPEQHGLLVLFLIHGSRTNSDIQGSYKWRDGGEGEFIADRKLTALRTERDDPAGRTGSVHSYILGVLAGLICLAHQALGVIIFSSLLFIGVKDTFPILARFAVSAVVVQAIRTFEVKTVLAGRSLSTRF